MRKLLNTLYVTNENIYMTLDGENVVCKENNEVKLRLPFSNIEAIFCFSYLGCSPALMGKCADYGYLLTSYLRQADFWLVCRVRHTEMCC